MGIKFQITCDQCQKTEIKEIKNEFQLFIPKEIVRLLFGYELREIDNKLIVLHRNHCFKEYFKKIKERRFKSNER